MTGIFPISLSREVAGTAGQILIERDLPLPFCLPWNQADLPQMQTVYWSCLEY